MVLFPLQNFLCPWTAEEASASASRGSHLGAEPNILSQNLKSTPTGSKGLGTPDTVHIYLAFLKAAQIRGCLLLQFVLCQAEGTQMDLVTQQASQWGI